MIQRHTIPFTYCVHIHMRPKCGSHIKWDKRHMHLLSPNRS